MAVYLPLEKSDRIFEQMKRSNCKLWWVYDTDNVLIAENESDTGTIEDNYNELMGILNDVEGDYSNVVIRNKLPNKDDAGNYKRGANVKGVQKFEYRVKLRQAPGTGGGRGAAGISGFAGDIGALYLQMGDMKAQIATQPLMARIAELEKEAKEGKKGAGWEQIFDRVADKFFEAYDKEIKPGTTTTKAPEVKTVAGTIPTGKPLTAEEQAEASRKLGSNLKDLGAVLGTDMYAFMQDLAERGKENPALFKMFAEASVKKDLDLASLLKSKM